MRDEHALVFIGLTYVEYHSTRQYQTEDTGESVTHSSQTRHSKAKGALKATDGTTIGAISD